jgi:putative ABC transport system substrate-binding protein
MKKLLLSLILSVFLFGKILVVNSYSTKDQCGIPQLQGFLSKMYQHGYKLEDFELIFLKSRQTDKKDLIKKAKRILKNINKYDFVVTFDDAAFQLVGIPASKKGKWVYFSGMNYPYNLYEKKYHLPKNIAGVYEKVYIKESLEVFNKIKPIKKIAFFYSDGVGQIIKLQTEHELKNSVFEKKVDYIKVNTVEELDKKTKEVNNNPEYTLFMPFAMSLKENGKKIPFLKFKDIYLKNIKKPDISVNRLFFNWGFLGFGGVDFYKMGMQLADIVLKHPKKHIIENAKGNYFFINAKRAKEIHFKLPKWFLKKYVKVIDYD